jgi:hypothetical protein
MINQVTVAIKCTLGFAACVAALILVCCRTEETPRRARSAAASEGSNMIVELPTRSPLKGRNSFNCRALMESDMKASYNTSLAKGIEGKISAGQNAVSIEIEGPKTLAFLSQAGFSAGAARGPSFDILQNTQDHLTATFFDGSSVNTFVLNKTNGLAIWSKVRATFPGYGAPTGAQSYMVCQ